jgi:hypothetical protein
MAPFPKKKKKIYFRQNIQINKNFKSFLGKIREKKGALKYIFECFFLTRKNKTEFIF